jgi:hypothetical protein
MAAKRGGESRTGLVVFLVLFILISIGLGVTTYYGYEEANTQKKAAEDAKKEKEAWTKDANYWKFLALTYRAYVGAVDQDPTAEEIPGLRSEFEKGGFANARDNNKEAHTKLLKEAWSDQNPTRKWEGKKPVETYEQEIKRLNNVIVVKNTALKEAEDKLKAKEDELKTAQNQLAQAKLDFQKELVNKDTNNLNQLTALKAEVENRQKLLEEWGKKPLAELEDQKKNLVAAHKDIGDLKKKLDEAVKTAKRNQDELAAVRATAEEIDITKMNPDNLATIQSINRTGDMPYISLGSADNLRRQVTFSIFGKGVDGRPLKEPKGKLEVIRITGEHQAQAQITELRDERRDPVLPGDFIYNPAWNRNLTQHVVLIGKIDLTGEGRDNSQELIRNLRNQNVEVDAYMELKGEYKLRKPGSDEEAKITRATDLVIVGTGPEKLGASPVVRGGIPDKNDPKEKWLTTMDNYQREADRLGVRVMRLNNFLEMSGYPLPKSPEKAKIDFHKTLEATGTPVKQQEPPKK